MTDVGGFTGLALRVKESYETKRASPPLAWRYECAHAMVWIDGKPSHYTDWRWCLSETEPHTPSGSIRNITPLYARSQ